MDPRARPTTGAIRPAVHPPPRAGGRGDGPRAAGRAGGVRMRQERTARGLALLLGRIASADWRGDPVVRHGARLKDAGRVTRDRTLRRAMIEEQACGKSPSRAGRSRGMRPRLVPCPNNPFSPVIVGFTSRRSCYPVFPSLALSIQRAQMEVEKSGSPRW